jgi:hypothetical protein
MSSSCLEEVEEDRQFSVSDEGQSSFALESKLQPFNLTPVYSPNHLHQILGPEPNLQHLLSR